jgi:hypothetical protein
MRTTLLALTLLATTPALALDAACETYLAAAEKSARQPARHTVSQPGDGSTLEAIIIGSKYYATMDGTWRPLPGSPGLQGELKMIAAIRSGEYPITGCRESGTEVFEGVPRKVIRFTLRIPGIPAEETRTFIGSDGLVYGQTSGGTKVKHRYAGVRAPAS